MQALSIVVLCHYPATLNDVLGSCLQKSKFYRGVPEPLGTPPPYAPDVLLSCEKLLFSKDKSLQCILFHDRFQILET